MKIIVTLLLFLVIADSGNAQEIYFHELRGLEDSTGVTHLYYRIHESANDDEYENHIYHFDTGQNIDSLFLRDETLEEGEPLFSEFYVYQGVINYSFLNNNPEKLIYTEALHHAPPSEYLKHSNVYDWRKEAIAEGGGNFQPSSSPNTLKDRIVITQGELGQSTSFIFNKNVRPFHISECVEKPDSCQQLNSMIFAQHKITGDFIAGRNDTLFTLNNELEVTWNHPFDMDDLYNFRYSNFYFDNDSVTTFVHHPESKSLYRIKNNADSTIEKLGDFNSVSIDPSIRGKIYVSDSTEVFYSDDYGNNFIELIDVGKVITGLYKKPASDIIYILTKKALYLFDGQDLTSSDQILISNEWKEDTPLTAELLQNYPNPFNPSTQISYALTEAAEVRIDIINSLGQQVATLVNERKNAGRYTVQFNASGLSSGVYFYTIQTGNFRQTKKMLLIK